MQAIIALLVPSLVSATFTTDLHKQDPFAGNPFKLQFYFELRVNTTGGFNTSSIGLTEKTPHIAMLDDSTPGKFVLTNGALYEENTGTYSIWAPVSNGMKQLQFTSKEELASKDFAEAHPENEYPQISYNKSSISLCANRSGSDNISFLALVSGQTRSECFVVGLYYESMIYKKTNGG
ncbi:hypothetical protein NEOLI_001335 [Neolecta irregularis DAH-3]|uniref:Uncharacterized protein n=1 Tax=Neolecta irregularis (strain DAH-3) TaxID=1198029 RepID=A0A1U7LW48_NEOID|nr:hypothetical protein NEOLI_001335 [Neolecta irregularis DAH-3]|eukprot:OLL26731.1 hypothetical protein NEOLI_001335 [Neolecta irregularis DAH-3]